MAGMMLDLLPPLTAQLFWLPVSLITLATVYYSGGHFYRGAWQALKRGSSNMDTLITLGTASAWIYSTFVVLFISLIPDVAQHVYFETAVMILAFINAGSGLESRAQADTATAIEKLIKLAPKTTTVIRDGQEVETAISKIQVDDLIRIRPGEKIAVDGVIIEGQSHLDESMLTGEAMPISKARNDLVYAGTINKTGSFVFRATAIGEKTALANIIHLVQQAQQSKPSIAKLADRISGIFVPVVISIAILTATLWLMLGPQPKIAFSLTTSMAVLLIACPCALGLATPISVMLGIGRAADHGILIKNADALQLCANITTVVFDKTGTLTQAKPTVVKILPLNHFTEHDILTMAASVEQHSEHPWAKAIIKAAKQQHCHLKPATHFNAIEAAGVQAHIDNKTVLVGNLALLTQHNITPDKELNTASFTAKAQTPIYVAISEQLAGIIIITDPIKDEAKTVIAELNQQQINTIMLTGDQQHTADAIAKQLGITQVIAEVKPKHKAEKIRALQQQGEVVAMVGDGINDAPALTQADIGFAIGTGTDVAIESADVSLMAGKLDGVTKAIHLSQITMRNIKQNLFGAFVYNSLGIPIAAGVLYPWLHILLNPMFAALAMAASSLTVVLNASRLAKNG